MMHQQRYYPTIVISDVHLGTEHSKTSGKCICIKSLLPTLSLLIFKLKKQTNMNGFMETLIDFIGEDEMEFAMDFENSWMLEFYSDEANYD